MTPRKIFKKWSIRVASIFASIGKIGTKKTASGAVDFKKYSLVTVIQDQKTAFFSTTVITLPSTPHEILGWFLER